MLYLLQEDRNGIDHHSRRSREGLHHVSECTRGMVHLNAQSNDVKIISCMTPPKQKVNKPTTFTITEASHTHNIKVMLHL